MHLKPALVFAVCVLLANSCAHAGVWPRFRGPTDDGVVTELQLPLHCSTNENLLWHTALPGHGSSSPIVSKGRVFLTCWNGYGRDLQNLGDQSMAVRASGEVVWKQVLQPKPDRIYASPILVGERLYFPSRNRGVFVIEAKPDFKQLAHNPPLDPTPFNGSPAVSDGQLFLRSDRAIYCIGGK